MIRPVNNGQRLLEEIERSVGPRPALWWLGQSGFAIKYCGLILYIDPYLSESLTEKYKHTERPHIRMTEAPFRGHEVTHADVILSTHGHSDHLDPGTAPAMLAASPRAKLVLPRALVEKARGMGIAPERMLPIRAGEQVEFSGDGGACRIAAVPSAHETLDWNAETGYAALGYILQCGDCAIYHPGDCVLYEGLAENLRRFRVTVALLPINGRDPRRGVAGNFEIGEAAALAEEIGAQWLVPMHYDMFTFNTVDVGRFVEHMETRRGGVRHKVLLCGEKWSLPGE